MLDFCHDDDHGLDFFLRYHYAGDVDVGQGLCLAVEDAVVLAWHLKQQGICEAALRRCVCPCD